MADVDTFLHDAASFRGFPPEMLVFVPTEAVPTVLVVVVLVVIVVLPLPPVDFFDAPTTAMAGVEVVLAITFMAW